MKPDIKALERAKVSAREAFTAAALSPDITKEEYDMARDAYIAAMRAHHEALGLCSAQSIWILD